MQPHFQSFAEFIHMGGKGIYVWSSWGIVIFSMVALIIISRQQRQKTCQQILNQHTRQQQRKHQTKTPS